MSELSGKTRAPRRYEYNHLYNTREWRMIRRMQLMEHPLCAMCEQEGRVTEATVCDHITPHRGDLKLFFEGPFQSLCKLHHDGAKQSEEINGYVRGGDSEGTPYDEGHHWNIGRQPKG